MNTQRWMTYSQSVTLDGTGYGYIRVAPAGRTWYITSMNVRVSTKVAEASVRTYTQQIGEQYQMDSTEMGSTGDTSNTQYTLTDGQPLFIEWTGGDAGATASVTISGYETVDTTGSVFRAIQ